MSTNIIERSLMVDESLEVRESADGRRVCGIAAPFNKRFGTGSYVEEFARGAFAKSIADRGDKIPLLEGHRQDAMPLGRAIHLEERTDGLYAEFLISRTGRGEEALALAIAAAEELDPGSLGLTWLAATPLAPIPGRPDVTPAEIAAQDDAGLAASSEAALADDQAGAADDRPEGPIEGGATFATVGENFYTLPAEAD